MKHPIFLLILAMAAPATGFGAEDGAVFFREKVHPLLEAKCYKCHGGEEKLKGNFRMTSRAGLLRGGDYGPGYDEKNPAESLLLQMISYKDEDSQMPPKAKLPEEERQLLAQWVEMGVPYDPELEIEGEVTETRGFTVSDEDRSWWAYRPLNTEDLPEVSDGKWSGNPIDRFVKSQLEGAALEPNGPASAGQLVRRLYYDLLGLPPTPEEVISFETAAKTDFDFAYEHLVDDLLSRPQYGEKWGRHWLDVVRYAESNGFERDNSKPQIWRYRDYVIDAFNRDKPYDQFITEQIAGDEIENPTMDSLVATGYYRLMQWDDEPADRKQHVYDVLADNVQVTSEAFLGTTIGCARCHDHKADPISQKDYYSFMAFFHGVTPYDTPGTIRPWAEPAELEAFEKERKVRLEKAIGSQEKLEGQMVAYLKETGELTDSAEKMQVTTFVDDARATPATWFYTTAQPAPGWKEVGQKVKSWNKAQGGFGKQGTPNSVVTTEWNTPDIWMRTDFGATEIPETLILELYHDEDVEVYLNGVLIYQAKGYVTDYEVIELGQEALDGFQTGKNVLAAHCRQTAGGQFIDMALRTGAQKANNLTQALKRGGKRLEKRMNDKFGRDVVKEWKDAKAQIAGIRKEVPGIPLNVVKESGPEVPQLNVHLRGSAHALGDEVEPGFPAVLGEGNDPLDAEVTPVTHGKTVTPGRRLALAQWMVDPDNPLTPRVIVNRLWQHHFGRGIVPSSNDFGKLGEMPTHPELLDFLAAQLIEEGWSLKAIHRLILTSQTYRMSSAPNRANLEKDPQNNLFWRFNMRRLTAEELRDSILAISGRLNLEQGGEWVYPPLPAEVLATASQPGKGWPVSKKETDYYRRSIYIHVKRSLRHPMMADFDQADTDTSCAVRFATTVPTQSLAMLNSAFVNDQAAEFAEHLRASSDASVEARVRRGLELVFQRTPNQDEVSHCVDFVRRLESEKKMDEEEAMERFALLALNLNEFIYLD